MTGRLRSTLALAAAVCGALSVGMGAHAQERVGEAIGLIVQGTGEVRIRPDIARLNLGVQTRGRDSQEAARQNAELTTKVIAAIRAAGVEERDTQTANYSIFPVYDHRPPTPRGGEPQEPRIIGYQVSNTVNVTVRQIENVGRVIDAAVQAGANMAGGIAFDLDDPIPSREEALRRAVANAQRKASIIAQSANVGLGGLAAVIETQFDFPRPMYAMDMRMEMAQAAPTPIEPGEQTITARVTARYHIGAAPAAP